MSGRTTALVLFGHCYVDYREAYADPELESMRMNVVCLFGNATFLMPEGADVRPSVVSLLASTAFDVPPSDEDCSLPTIIIESTTVLGRCRVVIGDDETDENEVVEEDSAADDVTVEVEPIRRFEVETITPPAIPADRVAPFEVETLTPPAVPGHRAA